MKKVIFVGDKPSSKNTDQNVPFIGTQSHKTLIKWIKVLEIKLDITYYLANSHNDNELYKIYYWYLQRYKVIALGNNASKRLNKMNIEHLKLPHPSPRNHQLNNKKFIRKELQKAKEYINEI